MAGSPHAWFPQTGSAPANEIERQHLNGICVTTRAVNQVHRDKQPGTNERVSKTRRGRAASGSGREHSPWVYEMLCLALF